MKLEKAGAGLPEKERLFIRLFLVPIVGITINWTTNLELRITPMLLIRIYRMWTHYKLNLKGAII